MFTKDEMNLKIVLFFLQYMQWQGVIYVCVNESADCDASHIVESLAKLLICAIYIRPDV